MACSASTLDRASASAADVIACDRLDVGKQRGPGGQQRRLVPDLLVERPSVRQQHPPIVVAPLEPSKTAEHGGHGRFGGSVRASLEEVAAPEQRVGDRRRAVVQRLRLDCDASARRESRGGIVMLCALCGGCELLVAGTRASGRIRARSRPWRAHGCLPPLADGPFPGSASQRLRRVTDRPRRGGRTLARTPPWPECSSIRPWSRHGLRSPERRQPRRVDCGAEARSLVPNGAPPGPCRREGARLLGRAGRPQRRRRSSARRACPRRRVARRPRSRARRRPRRALAGRAPPVRGGSRRGRRRRGRRGRAM